MRVIDDEQHRDIGGDLRDEVQRGHRDPIGLRRDLVRESKRGVERVPLNRRQLDCTLAYGTEHLMQPGKGQIRFGLHAGRGEHNHASLASRARCLGQQTRFPDTRLAAEHERLATRCDLVHERRQEPLFVCATEKGRDLVMSRAEHVRLILPLRARGDASPRVSRLTDGHPLLGRSFVVQSTGGEDSECCAEARDDRATEGDGHE